MEPYAVSEFHKVRIAIPLWVKLDTGVRGQVVDRFPDLRLWRSWDWKNIAIVLAHTLIHYSIKLTIVIELEGDVRVGPMMFFLQHTWSKLDIEVLRRHGLCVKVFDLRFGVIILSRFHKGIYLCSFAATLVQVTWSPFSRRWLPALPYSRSYIPKRH